MWLLVCNLRIDYLIAHVSNLLQECNSPKLHCNAATAGEPQIAAGYAKVVLGSMHNPVRQQHAHMGLGRLHA